MSRTYPYISPDLRVEDSGRALFLFGRTCASYKLSLHQTLLELKPHSGQLVRLEELAVPYSRLICEHLRHHDKQGTAAQSRFLDACRKANSRELSAAELIECTVRWGFANVIDAFHIVAGAPVPEAFFIDERASHGGIRVTDALSKLLACEQVANFAAEIASRWSLLESAWGLGMSQSLMAVQHDGETNTLFVFDPKLRRRQPITGAREALSGYQKGHCFYCFRPFALAGGTRPELDHFLPHCLVGRGLGAILLGVWNLVLACEDCNRGNGGKGQRIPTSRLLERLHIRNEFLISSHHPLRETLLAQTGLTESDRRTFLNAFHSAARAVLFHEWKPREQLKAVFSS